jgi:hypothetical protein
MDDNRPSKTGLNQPVSWPLWLRIAIMAGIGLWFALDLYHGNSMWAAIAFAMLCYGAWTFFLNSPKTPDNPPQ